MKADDIIKELSRLPLNKQIYVIEKTIQSIRIKEETNQMAMAAETLANDYINDKELISFTNLDFENFYEAR